MQLPPDAAADAATSHSPLEPAYAFYNNRLTGGETARTSLAYRRLHDPAVIARMRIGYLLGARLSGYLQRLGYSPQTALASGLVDSRGRDCLVRSITFPLPHACNFYGPVSGNEFCRHRCPPGGKGRLYSWGERMARVSVLVVEGLFDLAAL